MAQDNRNDGTRIFWKNLASGGVAIVPVVGPLLKAAIFDTCAVLVAFNEVLPEIADSVLINHTFKLQFKPLIDQNLVPVAYNREELLSWINRSMEQRK